MFGNRRSLVLAAFLLAPLTGWNIPAAHAENWVAVGPAGSVLWYDSQTVRTTANRLIAVWLSNSPARTQTGADGRTSYAIYTLVDCKNRKAGSKLSLDSGTPLQIHEQSSGMGALIAKLCV